MKLTKISLVYYFLSLLLAACITGCSGSDDAEPVTLMSSTTTISGTVFAAPVKNASVLVKDSSGHVIAGPVATANDGSYRIEVPNELFSSELVFESSSGTFDDEASGDADVAAGMLAAHVSAGSLGSGSLIHLTPGTTIIHHLVGQHGHSISDAESAFNGAFGYSPNHAVSPTDASNPGANVEDAQKLAGLRAAAFSQLTMDLGLNSADQFDLLVALADDLSNGSCNGLNAAGAVAIGSTMHVLPEDIQNKFSNAMVNYRNGGNDNTGLTNDQIGNLPFAKVALTDNYRIEYIPGMMEAMVGKTMFKLLVTDRYFNAPVPGLTISLMPMMHMAMHHHSTPVDSVSDNGDGTYTASVYYLMASSMMNGMSMGYWQLNVMVGGVGGESAVFFPSVMMRMGGDTVQARLKGQNDQVAGMNMGDMSMPESRTYYLFNDGVSGATGNHSLGLFIAAKESMMSFPALETGMTLNSGDINNELSVSNLSVAVSVDASTWITATESGNGRWTASGISGLTDGVEGVLYVRLTVNGEQKTTDGNAVAGDGSNDYAMFTITPAALMSSM